MNELLERLLAKVDLSNSDGCWEWLGAPGGKGYGHIQVDRRKHFAHRLMYETLVGSIPDGLQLDHLCRNRLCVNPDHLEPVTNRENWRRGDHPAAIVTRTGVCQRGHSMEDAYVDTRGWRLCRTCKLEYVRNRRRNA